ncbi:MAG: hypothetical protein DCC71_21885 [Proteobacteria bacterium]|nr:MAG: hypothetical protein DCC71_21885 [Pseudomonadota bacterium]
MSRDELGAALRDADAALLVALREGDAGGALAWSERRHRLVERLADRHDGSEASRAALRGLAAATRRLAGEARAERDAVLAEIGEVRARRGLLGRLRAGLGEQRDAPRFVSQRA